MAHCWTFLVCLVSVVDRPWNHEGLHKFGIAASRPQAAEKDTSIIVEQAHFEGGPEPKAEVVHVAVPLAIFILAPLTLPAVEDFKAHIAARMPSRIEIYTSSDTLRCGQAKQFGGQLPSQEEACKILLGDLADKPGEYDNMYGEHLNQAWLGEEWRELMKYINTISPGRSNAANKDSDSLGYLETVEKVQVHVYIYPFQLFMNPAMDKALEAFDKPALFKSMAAGSEEEKKWKGKSPLEKYWYQWALSSEKFGDGRKGKLGALQSLGVVMDFQMRHNKDNKEQSLAHNAQEADWCSARSPNKKYNWCSSLGTASKPFKKANCSVLSPFMVYIDLLNDKTNNFCDAETIKIKGHRISGSVMIKVTDVMVAIPKDEASYKVWLDKYVKTVKEVMGFQPSKHGEYSKLAETVIDMDTVIYQDVTEADGPTSVLWLLKNLKFRLTRLVVAVRPTNFHIPPAGASTTTIIESSESRRIPVAGDEKTVKAKGIPFRGSFEAVFQKAVQTWEHTKGEADVAWPAFQVASPSSREVGRRRYVMQPSLDKYDSELMVHHDMWRWRQWLARFTVLPVDVVPMGSARTSPVSQAVMPYTFCFFDDTAPPESIDWVLTPEKYNEDLKKLTSQPGLKTKTQNDLQRDEVWRMLEYVWTDNTEELLAKEHAQASVDSKLRDLSKNESQLNKIIGAVLVSTGMVGSLAWYWHASLKQNAADEAKEAN